MSRSARRVSRSRNASTSRSSGARWRRGARLLVFVRRLVARRVDVTHRDPRRHAAGRPRREREHAVRAWLGRATSPALAAPTASTAGRLRRALGIPRRRRRIECAGRGDVIETCGCGATSHQACSTPLLEGAPSLGITRTDAHQSVAGTLRTKTELRVALIPWSVPLRPRAEAAGFEWEGATMESVECRSPRRWSKGCQSARRRARPAR